MGFAYQLGQTPYWRFAYLLSRGFRQHIYFMPAAPHTPQLDFTTQGLKNLSDSDLLRAYWVYTFVSRPGLVNLGSSIGGWSVNYLAPARWAVGKTIFAQFCGGESVEECRPTMQRLGQKGISTILDYSVEGAKNEASFEATANEIAHTIEEAALSKQVAFSVFKVTGLGPTDVIAEASKNLKAAGSNPEAQKVAKRVDRLCRLAHDKGVRIFVDAEETWLQPYIDYLALEAMRAYNRERPIIFNTYQFYLKDGLERLKADSATIFDAGCQFGAKLVRGAYMEKEAGRASAEGKPNPINLSKEASDVMYDEASLYCLDHLDKTAYCLGTHNADSCRRMVEHMAERDIAPDDTRIWFAQLLGMSDNLSYPLAEAGYNVAKYVPYGPVKAVVPYLIRRAQENTTVAGQSGRELTMIRQEVKRRCLNVFGFFMP